MCTCVFECVRYLAIVWIGIREYEESIRGKEGGDAGKVSGWKEGKQEDKTERRKEGINEDGGEGINEDGEEGKMKE